MELGKGNQDEFPCGVMQVDIEQAARQRPLRSTVSARRRSWCWVKDGAIPPGWSSHPLYSLTIAFNPLFSALRQKKPDIQQASLSRAQRWCLKSIFVGSKKLGSTRRINQQQKLRMPSHAFGPPLDFCCQI